MHAAWVWIVRRMQCQWNLSSCEGGDYYSCARGVMSWDFVEENSFYFNAHVNDAIEGN